MTANKTLNTAISVVNAAVGKNRIINGGFDIWQRGTTSSSTGYVTADRWFGTNNNSFNRSSDVPSVGSFLYSLEFSSSSATYPYAAQRIESFNCTDLAGKTVNFSFWAKNVSGSSFLYTEIYYANSVDNFGSVTYIGAPTVVASPSSSWTFYSGTLTLPSQAANGIEVRIIRNNVAAATTRTTGVQLELGSVATPFDRRLYGQELALCQRYYQVMNGQIDTAQNGTSYSYATWFYKTTMRALPTVTQTGTAIGGQNNITTDSVQWFSTNAALRISTAIASIEL